MRAPAILLLLAALTPGVRAEAATAAQATPAAPAAALIHSIRDLAFDRGACYRVRDVAFEKEDIRIYLTDGHLIFSQPVAGRPIAALFTNDVEGGDGEVILFPPDRAERASLATFVHAPNLDSHFRSALFLFTGDDYAQLLSAVSQSSASKKTPELGPLLDEQYGAALRDIAAGYQTRIAFDLLGRPAGHTGFFAGIFDAPKLGDFEASYDPDNPEQISAGQFATKDNRLYFDTWTSFRARSARGHPAAREPELAVRDYRIDATIHPDLSLDAVTRLKVTPREGPLAAARFEAAPAIAFSSVTIDGRAAEVIEPPAQRGNLLARGNNVFLVVPSEPLAAGREYEFEFHHSGKVILDAGDGVYYVTARGAWYPTHGLQFASFDLTFRYPRAFDLVAPGEIVEDHTEGDTRVTRRRTANTIRMAAFNLGSFAHAAAERGGYTVDVWANRKLEAALQPRPPAIVTDPVPIRRRPSGVSVPVISEPPLNPLARLQSLATDVASALDFMATRFGPPTLPHLAVSPIPGAFGQGFPGLIYLSTLAYLNRVPQAGALPKSVDLFFEDVLQAHETAHQWWGNRVTAASYRDYWLMEALANYSALLYLEKRKGPHALDDMLNSYRSALLEKNEAGQTKESAGPIVLGQRLQNSIQPAAWTAITYGKGSWILQMLRRRMGDAAFLSLLSRLTEKYDHAALTTDQFRQEAARSLPSKSEDPGLEAFFDQWVYGTGIPALKFTYTLKGAAPALKLTGTLTQSGVDDDFSAWTPIEIQFGHAPAIVKWIASSSDPVTFTVTLKQPPAKVLLDPHNAVLKR